MNRSSHQTAFLWPTSISGVLHISAFGCWTVDQISKIKSNHNLFLNERVCLLFPYNPLFPHCFICQSCPRVRWTLGSGRVGSRFCRILAGRVSNLDFFSFSQIISWYLNPYESSNTTFGLIDCLRYLIYNN